MFGWQEGVKNPDKSNWQAQVLDSGSATCLSGERDPGGSWAPGASVESGVPVGHGHWFPWAGAALPALS